MRAANRHRRALIWHPSANRETGADASFSQLPVGSITAPPPPGRGETSEGKVRLMADTTGDAIPGTETVLDDGVRRRDFINIAAIGAG